VDNLGILTMGFLKSGGGYSNALIITCGFLGLLETLDLTTPRGLYKMGMSLSLS